MDVGNSKQQVKSVLCANCNKFWGTEAHEWLCSKCYGAKNKQDAKPLPTQQKKQETKQSALQQKSMPTKGVQQNKSKCFSCNKKVGLLGIECKCGYVYCNSHRLPEQHECSINYEQKGKEKLKKENVKIEHRKLSGFQEFQ